MIHPDPWNLSSEETERHVLGCIMIDPHHFDDEPITIEEFVRKGHREIFTAMQTLFLKNAPLEPISISEELKTIGKYDEVGGLATIWEIHGEVFSTGSGQHHRTILRRYYLQRELARYFQETTKEILERKDPDKILAQTEEFLKNQHEKRKSIAFFILSDVLMETLDIVDSVYKGTGEKALETQLKRLNMKIGGYVPGNLVIIGARPSMGKSAFALGSLVHAADQGKTAGIFSLEMSNIEIVKRFLSMGQDYVNVFNLDRGEVTHDGWQALTITADRISRLKIFLCDQASLTASQVVRHAHALKQKHGLDLLVIDYLQLMEIEGKKDNRSTGLGEISRQFKLLAKELNIPILLLSQLNRECEKRPDKRPMLSDLRESGGIEQDADVVLFIYRDEVYSKEEVHKGVAEILIRKNRNGPLGDVHCEWQGPRTRFID